MIWKGPEADEAFETLVRSHQRSVLNYCARRASRADAWDAASEVFLVAWRRFDDLPAESEVRAWLLGVAYKVLSNQRRSAARRIRLFERVASIETTTAVLAGEPFIDSPVDGTVLDALARLKPTDREVLQLTLWESLSREEIAQVLGVSTDAVHKRYSRAKKRLGDELAKEMKKMTGRATQVTATKGGTP
jgi:RNA polymerase sigma-70 factor (ECF subfamily)